MTITVDDLAEQYRSALQQYLGDAGESALERAYDLGRLALDSGFGIVEMAALQQRTLAEVLAARHPGEDAVGTVKVAQNFFVESLSPFEMTHRGFREANIALRRLNEHLNDKLEEVAKQIALALHDEAWQLLSVVYMDLAMADREVPEAARQRLRNVQG
ncbi:MAG: phosphatase RsbU N-terminal domain-containing protein, partial [Candidatus Dormibacteraceae bacterium]